MHFLSDIPSIMFSQLKSDYETLMRKHAQLIAENTRKSSAPLESVTIRENDSAEDGDIDKDYILISQSLVDKDYFKKQRGEDSLTLHFIMCRLLINTPTRKEKSDLL
eukprot:TRINITY_DN5141_c0_g2_i4.p7 TRINITY_DN5141_c0_g2~~TRINITY_DN5141_c0_g2_i4.p7  ORF type:complete len:107 (+),score=7.11 TRINITY_DN5141_c0_g2_i4:2027-2347(+)